MQTVDQRDASKSKRGGEKTPEQRWQENTEALKRVNRGVRSLLDRLPLSEQREIVELNRLLKEQERLMRVNIRGHVPLRTSMLNDNERERALHLKRRFTDAERRGKIRRSSSR
jgi:hypothetical protein